MMDISHHDHSANSGGQENGLHLQQNPAIQSCNNGPHGELPFLGAPGTSSRNPAQLQPIIGASDIIE
jgi:hypothetical protein